MCAGGHETQYTSRKEHVWVCGSAAVFVEEVKVEMDCRKSYDVGGGNGCSIVCAVVVVAVVAGCAFR